MNIPINKWTTVGSIQRAFGSSFPAFKLEFYSGKSNYESVFPDSGRLKPDYVIAANKNGSSNCNIMIESSDKVSDIEDIFYEKFGVCAQIYFKSKNRWIQTVKSDHYSLKRLEWESGFSRKFLLL